MRLLSNPGRRLGRGRSSDWRRGLQQRHLVRIWRHERRVADHRRHVRPGRRSGGRSQPGELPLLARHEHDSERRDQRKQRNLLHLPGRLPLPLQRRGRLRRSHGPRHAEWHERLRRANRTRQAGQPRCRRRERDRQPDLDRARRRRQPHHRLHRERDSAERRLRDVPRDGHELHRQRTHERHRLYLHGHRD